MGRHVKLLRGACGGKQLEFAAREYESKLVAVEDGGGFIRKAVL